MNKLINTLDISQWTLIGISLSDIDAILSIILLIVSILVGLLSIFLKVKEAMKDGKITKEEREDIENDIQELEDKVKKEN